VAWILQDFTTFTEVDPEVADLPIVRERQDNAGLNCIMSNSFGFGGTNATLVVQRYQG
jgi:3-oxoacyl-[acyl-carrier-protein] synthase-1